MDTKSYWYHRLWKSGWSEHTSDFEDTRVLSNPSFQLVPSNKEKNSWDMGRRMKAID